MADFAEQLQGDKQLKLKLVNALNNKHPFKHFNFIIHDAGDYRQLWFNFKKALLMAWVKEKLKEHLLS